MSGVRCQVPGVRCQVSQVFFLQSGGGSVIPVYFLSALPIGQAESWYRCVFLSVCLCISLCVIPYHIQINFIHDFYSILFPIIGEFIESTEEQKLQKVQKVQNVLKVQHTFGILLEYFWDNFGILLGYI